MSESEIKELFNPIGDVISSAVRVGIASIQNSIDELTGEYIVKACISSNIDKDTLIRQQEEINQLRTELNKFRAVEGYSIHGRQVYIRED